MVRRVVERTARLMGVDPVPVVTDDDVRDVLIGKGIATVMAMVASGGGVPLAACPQTLQ